MYDRVPLNDLKVMANVSERRESELFSMMQLPLEPDCGSTGCLIGSYEAAVGKKWWPRWKNGCGAHPSFLEADGISVERTIGIGPHVACFLFFDSMDDLSLSVPRAMSLSQSQAVARLRKYIRYVERKRALWEDHEDLMELSRADRHARLAETWERVGRSYMLADMAHAGSEHY